MLEELKKAVLEANLELSERQLVIYSWGNVSGIDRSKGIVAIKPSGVPYEELTIDKIVLVDLDGNVVEGDLNPSSDTPTHLELYRSFEAIGGICHTHSPNATMWAQACKAIPCFGTTHADYFYGDVPVTEVMTKEQIQNDYELNTGKIIVERFAGPAKAVEATVVLEHIAATALGTITINPDKGAVSDALLGKHYLRKHGKNAYYGQKT